MQSEPALKRAIIAAALVAVLLAGCGVTRNALPADLADRAAIPGMAGIRDRGDGSGGVLKKSIVAALRQAPPGGPVDVLAISGGGANGAFGAGLACGWSAAGTRPTFRIVTGISTGALMAPFVFLGPGYDGKLKMLYTTTGTADIYRMRSIFEILGGADSLIDTAPLDALIAETIDEKIIRAVAAEHRRGRRLFIGTTNLDASRLVVWDMGAIASSENPGAPDLFRKVLRASASIPTAFPPVYIEVTAGGKQYDEMHVDGGVSKKVFFHGSAVDFRAAARAAGIAGGVDLRVYVIFNSQVGMRYGTVRPRPLPIAKQSALKLMTMQGIGDLYRIYAIARSRGIDYNLAYIPDEFRPAAREVFDPQEMTRLFELGFTLAADGYPWRKHPPGFAGGAGRFSLFSSPSPGGRAFSSAIVFLRTIPPHSL